MDPASLPLFVTAATLLFGAALLRKLLEHSPAGAFIGPGRFTANEPPASSARPPATPSMLEVAATLADDPEAFIDSIPQLAETHRKIMERELGLAVDYDLWAFEQTDAFITAEWSGRDVVAPEATLSMVGSYVGECIRRLQGGTWGYTEGRGFHLDGVGGGARIYPFTKVAKRFENGMADSLATYYAALTLLIGRERAKHRH
jgi:hypothetical protein